jgi:hypothetical protein
MTWKVILTAISASIGVGGVSLAEGLPTDRVVAIVVVMCATLLGMMSLWLKKDGTPRR